MKALVIHGKQDMTLEEVPTPTPGPDQVLVRVAYAGICGSDLHYYFEGANGAFVVKEDLIPGHELSGTVALDPSGTYAEGTPVTMHPATFGPAVPGLEGHHHLWPGGSYLGSASTWPHTQGGMSEFLLVRKDMIRVLPASLPLTRAALSEPLAVALHGIAIAGDVRGKDILVTGSGPIGLLATFAAAALGANSVTSTDVLAGPLARAKALGATEVVNMREQELPTNYFPIVLECSGALAAINASIVATRPAGVIAQIGMLAAGPQQVTLAPYIAKEIQMRGSFRFKDEINQAIDLLDANPHVESAITHTVSADQALAAFGIAHDSEVSGKVLVDLWNDAK